MMGMAAGKYDVVIVAGGYEKAFFKGVTIQNGTVTELDAVLAPLPLTPFSGGMTTLPTEGQPEVGNPRTALTGTVQDSVNGECLYNAQVMLRGTPYRAVTDVDGKYYLAQVPRGIYDIVFYSIGYDSLIVTEVAIGLRKTVEVDARLPRAPRKTLRSGDPDIYFTPDIPLPPCLQGEK